MDLVTGAVIDGRYTIEAPLGRGGMGAVYRARHNELGTLHAIKVLFRSDPTVRERLVREGRSQGTLRHPHVVMVTDLVEVDGAPGLVLEFVDGFTLDEVLGAGDLSLDQVDLLARQILGGVAAAHRHGLVHRDLKPANVLIPVVDGQPSAKVADLGLAKVIKSDDDLTRSGMAMGTPGYMAPEQITSAKTVDARADVFALGVILYQLLTGLRPFEGSNLVELFERTSQERYPPLSPELPARIRETVTRCLRPEPTDRFMDAEQVLAAWVLDVPVAVVTSWV
jgi:serine/threonine-protein kinase